MLSNHRNSSSTKIQQSISDNSEVRTFPSPQTIDTDPAITHPFHAPFLSTISLYLLQAKYPWQLHHSWWTTVLLQCPWKRIHYTFYSMFRPRHNLNGWLTSTFKKAFFQWDNLDWFAETKKWMWFWKFRRVQRTDISCLTDVMICDKQMLVLRHWNSAHYLNDEMKWNLIGVFCASFSVCRTWVANNTGFLLYQYTYMYM